MNLFEILGAVEKDPILAARIKKFARANGLSLDRAVVSLLGDVICGVG